MNKILCIGQAVFDITFPVESTILENEKYRIYNRLECMGAPAANAAYLCSLWGANTNLIARIGNDLFGTEILKRLQTVSVNTDYIYIDKHNPTSISCIITNTENGNRTILNSPMADDYFPISLPEEIPNVILVDGHEIPAALEALERYPSAISIMDAGTYKKNLEVLISKINYLVCSESFAQQFTGIKININDKNTWINTFKSIEKLNSNTIVITLGDNGVLYKENNQIKRIEAFHVKAIDTTGAGDIFHGAFAYCMSEHCCLKDTILISSLTSSISVQSLGGQTSIPKKEAVWNQLKSLNIK